MSADIAKWGDKQWGDKPSATGETHDHGTDTYETLDGTFPDARPMVVDAGIVPSKCAPERPAVHHVVPVRTIKSRCVVGGQPLIISGP